MRAESKTRIRMNSPAFSTAKRTATVDVTDGDNPRKEEGPVDFERAIELTGYGKFNYLLLLAVLPAGCSSVYASTAMSYVLPSAECDLGLTLLDKGLLNSMAFAGMICSSFAWGFLADMFGRKTILVYGYLLDAIFNLASSFSQVSWMLLVFKFFNGVIISGPYAALLSYLAEVHGEKHRSQSYMWLGVFFSLGNISVPCVAWLIIPLDWEWTFFGDSMVFNSWRLFLVVCTVPEFIACLALSFFPESPRFLIAKGRHQEALDVFKKIYSINTGNHPDTYAVKSLVQESSIEASGKSLVHMLRCGLRQMKPLFEVSNLSRLILITSIQFGATLGSNSLRLWMPQLFAMIETYEKLHPTSASEVKPTMCYMLDATKYLEKNLTDATNITTSAEPACTQMILDSTVYMNSMIIALTGVIGYTIAGSLINAVGKQKLMIVCFVGAGACCGALYWAQETSVILSLTSIFVALASIGGATVMNVIVDNFPTFLRTMAVSITMMCGRVGAVVGNMLFPILLNAGCLGPFIMIGTACLACAVWTIILPSGKITAVSKEEGLKQ
ncbi:synaptic vesicle glycoprotein 2C-like isoform X2 [Neodiprion fabricii]|uniref:synaptic vesicle glycoprotein 2C-like isoform X2 n=1 Tax=Neodiprion fabricii TaxID=2872261 RepID=UPI001ED9685E|nr:synaptic vesicle glycoprotein 2C-like isoform X2 [Neodiprion fabricii]